MTDVFAYTIAEAMLVEMINQLSNNYLLKKFIVYMHTVPLADLVREMINQPSIKYLPNKLVINLDGQQTKRIEDLLVFQKHHKGPLHVSWSVIDQMLLENLVLHLELCSLVVAL